MNPHYNKTNAPVSFSRGRSQTIRDEFGLIEAGFDSVEAAMALLAPKASPTFTGTVSASSGTTVNFSAAATVMVPTVTNVSDNTTKAASTAFVQSVLGASGSLLPPQATHNGKFLFTNGTSASWQFALPSPRVANRYLYTDGTNDSWKTSLPVGTIVGAALDVVMPSNFLPCNQSSHLNTSYPALAAILHKAVSVERTVVAKNNLYAASPQPVAGPNGAFFGPYFLTSSGFELLGRDFNSNSQSPFQANDGMFYSRVGTTLYRSLTYDGTYSSYSTSISSNVLQIARLSGDNYYTSVWTFGTMQRSANAGVNWNDISDTQVGPTFPSALDVSGTIYALGSDGSNVYLKKSTNLTSWSNASTITTGSSSSGILMYNPSNTTFYYQNGTTVRTATSESGPWTSQTAIDSISVGANTATVAFNNFFVVSSSGIFMSSTGATGSWTNVTPTGFSATGLSRLILVGNRLYVMYLSKTYAGSAQDFFAYTTNGTSWTVQPMLSTLTFAAKANGKTVASTGTNGIFVYADSYDGPFWATSTTTWRTSSRPFVLGTNFVSLGNNGSAYQFIVSADDGQTCSGISGTWSGSTPYAGANSTYVLAGNWASSTLYYTDGTTRYTTTGPTTSVNFIGSVNEIWFVCDNGTNIWFANNANMIAGTWTLRTLPRTFHSTNCFFWSLGATLFYAHRSYSEIWYTSDYGVTWTSIALPTGVFPTAGLAVNNQHIIVYDDYATTMIPSLTQEIVYNAPIPVPTNANIVFASGNKVIYHPRFVSNTSCYDYVFTISTTHFMTPTLAPAKSGDNMRYWINAE